MKTMFFLTRQYHLEGGYQKHERVPIFTLISTVLIAG